MNKPLKPKGAKQKLSLPVPGELQRLPASQRNELRQIINGIDFTSLIETVLATTLSKYPSRDPIEHIQTANTASRDAVYQFVNDLYEEVNTPDEKDETEQYT
jgi:hypothetical protein